MEVEKGDKALQLRIGSGRDQVDQETIAKRNHPEKKKAKCKQFLQWGLHDLVPTYVICDAVLDKGHITAFHVTCM